MQAPARRGIGDVGASGEDRHRRRRRVLERADVRGRVDPHRHAGDDRYARGAQAAAERARDLETVRRAAARSDDRDAVDLVERAGAARDVHDRGRIGKLAQPRPDSARRSGRRP